MILYLYAFKDKKLGAFTQIYTDNIDFLLSPCYN